VVAVDKWSHSEVVVSSGLTESLKPNLSAKHQKFNVLYERQLNFSNFWYNTNVWDSHCFVKYFELKNFTNIIQIEQFYFVVYQMGFTISLAICLFVALF